MEKELMLKRLNIFHIIPVLISFSLLLNSCRSELDINSGLQTTNDHQVQAGCLRPLYDGLAYHNMGTDEEVPIPGIDLFELPPDPWQPVTALPEIDGLSFGDRWLPPIVNVLLTREQNGHTEVWVSIPILRENHYIFDEYYLGIFRTNTKEWSILSERISDLLIGKDGSLWGIKAYETKSGTKSLSIINKFDEETGSFNPVEEVQNIPSGQEYDGLFSPSSVLIDDEGIFWIIVPYDAIYTYNTNTNEVEKKKDLDELVIDAQTTSEGSIYLLVDHTGSKYERPGHSYFLFHYYLETDEFESIPPIALAFEPLQGPRSIFIDSKDR